MDKLTVWYNSDEDQIYIKGSQTAWTEVGGATVSTLFCGDCNFWHYIGEFEDKVPKYWICHPCAIKKGWKISPWPVTSVRGICSHCDQHYNQTLIPVVDFGKPNGQKAIWD